MTGTWILVAPLLCVAIGGLAMMLADAFSKDKSELAIMSAVILFSAGGLSLGLSLSGPPAQTAGFIGSFLAYDRMAFFLDLVICGGGALAALLAGGYLREHKLERGEFYILLVFAAFGAMVLGRAVDLLSIFVGLETMSLGVYGLVAFRRASPRSAEAGMKYFLLGSFASAILLFGMALVYGATNHTNIAEIAAFIEAGTALEPTLIAVGIFLIVAGLAFKIAAVPFHAWTPDAYEGAVTPATTFMAVVVKAAVMGLLLRLLFVAFGHSSVSHPDSGWPGALAGLAALTMVFGNLAGIGQKSVKRMLAYSSISHAGLMLVGVVAAANSPDHEGLSAVLFYLLAYMVSNVLAFGALIMAGSYGREAVSYEDLSGLGRRHPLIAIPFVLGILSLMGFPPTAGFFAKYYVILSAIRADGQVWLAVLAVLTSAVGAYYYLKVLVFLFMKTPEEGKTVAVPMRSPYVLAALVVSGYFVLRIGMAPDSYLELAMDAANQLLS